VQQKINGVAKRHMGLNVEIWGLVVVWIEVLALSVQRKNKATRINSECLT